MSFEDFIKNSANPGVPTMTPRNSEISIYPISESNLEAIKILISNCMRMGVESNNNVTIATHDPSLWLGGFLDKYWSKISYVVTLPNFSVLKMEGNSIINNTYKTDIVSLHTDDELDRFFNLNKWKKFALFSVVKFANLSTMKSFYQIRYSDITEKYEERDGKIDEILN